MCKTRRKMFVLSVATFVCSNVMAQRTISLNFAHGTGEAFAGSENIGPLATDSTTWNSTLNRDSGELANGSIENLIDGSVRPTGVSALWKSANTWYELTDGTGDDQHKLAAGYLDDGAGGCSVTFSNITYAAYRVYGLLSSDMIAEGTFVYTSLDFEVDGVWARGDNAPVSRSAHSNITRNYTANDEWWTETGANVTGNYWTVIAYGPTLTVKGYGENPRRGSLAGIVIEEVAVTNRIIGFNFTDGGWQNNLEQPKLLWIANLCRF